MKIKVLNFLLAYVSFQLIARCQQLTLEVLKQEIGKKTDYKINSINFQTWNNNNFPFQCYLQIMFPIEFNQGSTSIVVENSKGTQEFPYQLSNSNYIFYILLNIQSSNESLILKNFVNPSYSGIYSLKYVVRNVNTTIKTSEILTTFDEINSTDKLLLSLSKDHQTNTQGTLSLSIDPAISLPLDSAIRIKIPEYGSFQKQLQFISNPVTCRKKQQKQGDPDVLCEFNSQNELIISQILGVKQTAPEIIQIEVLNVLSPFSTKPVSDFSIILFGYSNGRNIQQETGKQIVAKTASKPKSLIIQSTNQQTLSNTSLTINILAQTYFSSQFILTIKFPTEFNINSFKNQLKGFNSEGKEVVLTFQNNDVIQVQSDIVVPSDVTKMQLRLEGVVNYQGALKTSTFFEVIVYSDSTLSNKVYEDLTSLNYQTIVNQLNVNNFSFSPSQVQTLSSYILEIELINALDEANMNQNRFILTLPSQLRFGDNFISAMQGKGQRICTTLTEFIEFIGQNSSALCEIEKDSIIRVYQFYNKEKKIAIKLKQITNPYSTEKTQPFLIEVEILKGSNTQEWLKVYQNNQLEEKTRVIATSGEISVKKFESTGSQTTFDTSSYFISFDIASRLIPSSYIVINFPSDDFFFTYMNFSNCSCEFSEGLITAKTKCIFDNRNLVEIALQSEQSLQIGQRISVLLRGMRNPRSLKPTKPIIIQTLSPSKSVVDEIKSQNEQQKLIMRMQTSSTLTIISVQPTSFFIGDITTYTITIQSPSEIQNGDTLIMSLSDIEPSSQTLTCNGIQGFSAVLNCSVENKSILMKLTATIKALEVIQYTIQGLRNPYSNLLSSPLIFELKDREGYSISQTQFIEVARRGSIYGFDTINLQNLEIKPESMFVGKVTTFKINFTLPIPVKSNLTIVINLAKEIDLSDSPLECFFLLKDIEQSKRAICQYQKAIHTIQITNFAPSPQVLRNLELQNEFNLFSEYQHQFNGERLLTEKTEIPIFTQVTVLLTGIKNKITNGPFKTDESSQMKVAICSISNDNNQEIKYNVLAQSTFNLPPSFICSEPCGNCSGIDSSCTSCKDSMILQPEDGKCQDSCPHLFAHVQQNSDYSFPVCLRCSAQYKDIHCSACSPQDLSKCTDCIEKFKLIYDQQKGDYCEEITSANDPLRIFVYDIEFNLPYISTYIICIILFTMIRKIWMVKNLQIIVVLISAFSLIETILLIAFVVKVILLEKFLPILIAALLLSAYFAIHIIFARKFRKSIFTDAGFTLYEPSYKTIRIISNIALLINFKFYLMYRSQFSIIRDIYNIPFNNCQQHLYAIKKGLQLALVYGILLICFVIWVMNYTYNYRHVLIPPFYFIEYSLYQFLICIFLIFFLFPRQGFNINILFDVENESSNKYKITQIDLKVKTPSVMILSKQQQEFDPSNQNLQIPLSYMTENIHPPSSNNTQFAASKVNLPHSANNLNSQVNIQSILLNNQEIQQKQKTLQSIITHSNTNLTATVVTNNNKNILNKYNLITHCEDKQNRDPKTKIGQYQSVDSSIVGINQNIDNSLNQDISPSNFNSAQELQVHSRFRLQSSASPSLIILNPNQKESLINQKREFTPTENNSPYSQLGDKINGQQLKLSNNISSGSDGASDKELKAAKNSNIKIHEQNNKANNQSQKQITASVIKENKKQYKNELFDQNEQSINVHFTNQSISSQQEQKSKSLNTPQKIRSISSSSSSIAPQCQSTQLLKQDNQQKNLNSKLFASQPKITNQTQKQYQSQKLSQSTNFPENIHHSQSKQNDFNGDEENYLEQEQQDPNRMNLQQLMTMSKQHTNNFQNSMKIMKKDNIESKNSSNQQQIQKNNNLKTNQQYSQKLINSTKSLKNKLNELCSNQNMSNSDQYSKKYTESSDEVDEGNYQKNYQLCNNSSQQISNPQNPPFLNQESESLNELQQQKLDFQSPRNTYSNNMNHTKFNQNFEQNEEGTPQIGIAFQNSQVDSEKNSALKYQNQQQHITYPQKEDRQFQQFAQGINHHQNQISPNKSNQQNPNQSPLYTFSNPNKNAQISSNQIVSKFDQQPVEEEQQEIIKQKIVPSHPQENSQIFQSHQVNNNNQELTKYPMNQPANLIQNSKNINQINPNYRNPLISHDFINQYASITLKQSCDSRSSQYFPN